MQISCQLDSTRIILVGVSGGPDSLCLLDLLVKAGYPVVAAHLDHNLRVESGQDSEFVRQKALDYHIRFILATADVMGYARAEGITIEEAARQLRYQFLFQQASEVHAQAVLVGHNADDQVETILMHLLRGSGAAGLMGMPYRLLPNAWSQQIPLVRPLLGVFRSEILTYCQENNLQPLEDISNRDVKFLRNRLRHELLPLLETYNPRFREALLRTASVLQAEDSFIIRETDFAWRKCLQQSGTGYVGLSAPLLLDLPLALQRRIVQRAVVRVRARMQDWDFNMIDQALRFLQHPPATRQADLALGLRLLIEADTLWIAGWEADLPHAMWPQLVPGYTVGVSFTVDQEQRFELGSGWELSSQPLDINQLDIDQVTHNANPYQAWMDLSSLDSPLFLRGRLPGDRFQPLGAVQPMHLSDFLVNRKMPRRARECWPLVCSGDQIIWIPGYGIHHACRVTPASRKIVRFELMSSGS